MEKEKVFPLERFTFTDKKQSRLVSLLGDFLLYCKDKKLKNKAIYVKIYSKQKFFEEEKWKELK